MYDSVEFKLGSEAAKGVDFLSETPCYFDVKGEHNYKGNIVITGYKDNLKVSVSNSGVKVSNGSLCKYLLGDNLQTLTRGDVKKAIEKLSDGLHLPIDKANVTRIDAGCSIILSHEPKLYLNHLGNLNHYNRFLQDGSLYFQNSKRQLVFYDKIRELKAKKEPVPELYQNRNVLRYEMRFTKRLSHEFNISEVVASTLYNETFYEALYSRWFNEYKQISKVFESSLNFEQMNTKRDFYMAGLQSIIKTEGGELAMCQKLEECYKRGLYTRKQFHDLKQAFKEAASFKIETVDNPLVKELDKKIAETAKFYR